MNRGTSYKEFSFSEMKMFLDEKYLQYNTPSFIISDPISIPHIFTDNRDREISGFLTSAIAWGRRDLILRSSNTLVKIMQGAPYEFVMNAEKDEIDKLSGFVHRTFNGSDCKYFMESLRYIYSHYNSMEDVIIEGMGKEGSLKDGLTHFRNLFFTLPHQQRIRKHFADINGGAAGKRLNMFLRWMVRKDDKGVDFGIWNRIKPSMLHIPLDLHAGNTAREIGLLKRKINDWKAVVELTNVLKSFDPEDPVKYDFALFGAGVNKKNVSLV